MKKKKIISAISALAMAVSSFGAISASAITTEDIGNKFNQELAPMFKDPDYTYTFQDDGTLCSYDKYRRYYEDLGFTFDEICIPTDFSFNYSAPYGRDMFPYAGTNLIVTSNKSEEEILVAVNSIAKDNSITLMDGYNISKTDDGRYFIHTKHTIDDVKLADVKLAEALAQSDVFTSVTVNFFYMPVEIDYVEGFTLTLKDGVTFDAEKYGLTEDDVEFDSENNSYYIKKELWDFIYDYNKEDYTNLEEISNAISLYTEIGQDYADDIVEYYPHNVFLELYKPNRPSFQLTKVYKTFLGDANGDNSCNVQDMILYAKHIIGEDTTDENMVSTQSAEQTDTTVYLNSESTASGIADLNGDGKVDVTDLMLIAQYISGEIDKF